MLDPTNSKNADEWNNKGLILRQLKRYEEAIEWLKYCFFTYVQNFSFNKALE